MGIDFKIHTYASLPSTQDYVRELAEEDFPEGTVMQAFTQTKGRGRQGRTWESPMGNLYMSVLLRPACRADVAGQLSFVAAVALADAIGDVLKPEHKLTLKWPNDILIDGKKAAGILLESELDAQGRIDAIIMGMGVNIHAPPEGAVGLQSVTSEITVPVNKFRDALLQKLDKHYTIWKLEGFAPVRKAWLVRAHGINETLTVKVANREYKGIFRDIDAGGVLKLEGENGSIFDINSGDVYFQGQEKVH